MEDIPFVELKSRSEEFRVPLGEAIGRVVSSGQFVGGEEVERFEKEWAEYCGTKFCVGVGNGLDAIRLALQAHGIGPGDEVLVPAQTFIATWLAVAQTGATPVPVDIRPDTANMDPEVAASAVTANTAAIVVVHLHGLLADMASFRRLAETRGLLLIEDAAQAHGAERDGIRAGGFGDAAAFSFYPTKNLGALGDAGAVTTNDEQVAERLRLLRSYGAEPTRKYEHSLVGINSRLDPLQAAVLRVFLPHLDAWNRKRHDIANSYSATFGTLFSELRVPATSSVTENVWHHYVVRSPHRDDLRRRLAEVGVGSEIHYPISAVASGRVIGLTHADPLTFPHAADHASSVLSLPMHPWLASDSLDVILRITRLLT